MDALAQLTINTGHTRTSLRDEVRAATVAALAPLVVSGGGALPAPFVAYQVTILRDAAAERTATFTVQRRRDALPLVTGFVCWREDGGARFWAVVGTQLDGLRAMFPPGAMPTRLPPRPQTSPWLAVLVWPSAVLDRAALAMLGDLEQCLAWVLIEHD